MSRFKPGDVVQLKCGGPMCVVTDTKDSVSVVYHEPGMGIRCAFDIAPCAWVRLKTKDKVTP